MLRLHTFTFNAFSENTYIISNEHSDCWIVDPGMYDMQEVTEFRNYITAQNLKPKGILNTHAHIDHIFGVQAVVDAYKIPFAIHRLEMPVLQGAKGAAMLFGFQLNTIPQANSFIQEGEVLSLGDDKIEVRFVPGHSPGSIAFYYAAGGWIVSGDALFAGSIGRTDLPGGNHETLLRSIREALFTLPGETVVHSGHGPSTTIAAERETNPFFGK